ncbi:uncharacterized protein LOC132546223 [Ylistrum balloti]|uniref:uncharacterized protein LOC132546223 n=1 Tax=Ylistrum balloti TaxID=509963 RepID=UPI002905863C|nr:uncharacterized protein LOC132546223 [Ylistrum balloti]
MAGQHSTLSFITIGTGYLKEYIGMAKLSKDELTYIVVKDNSTLEDCKSYCYSHHRFYCEHNSTASTCAISERDISLYPIEFTLTYVGNDTISYVKTQNEQIDVTTSPVQNITYNFTDLPCYQEPAPPTTTIISTQSAEGDVTSSVSNDVNTAVYISPEYIEQLVVEIKEENTVDVKTLTSYRNKFISANDNRPSSKTIGSIGLIFIALLLGLILVSDVPKFIQDVKTLHGKPAKHTETCDNTFIFTKSKFSMKRRVSFRRNSM